MRTAPGAATPPVAADETSAAPATSVLDDESDPPHSRVHPLAVNWRALPDSETSAYARSLPLSVLTASFALTGGSVRREEETCTFAQRRGALHRGSESHEQATGSRTVESDDRRGRGAAAQAGRAERDLRLRRSAHRAVHADRPSSEDREHLAVAADGGRCRRRTGGDPGERVAGGVRKPCQRTRPTPTTRAGIRELRPPGAAPNSGVRAVLQLVDAPEDARIADVRPIDDGEGCRVVDCTGAGRRGSPTAASGRRALRAGAAPRPARSSTAGTCRSTRRRRRCSRGCSPAAGTGRAAGRVAPGLPTAPTEHRCEAGAEAPPSGRSDSSGSARGAASSPASSSRRARCRAEASVSSVEYGRPDGSTRPWTTSSAANGTLAATAAVCCPGTAGGGDCSANHPCSGTKPMTAGSRAAVPVGALSEPAVTPSATAATSIAPTSTRTRVRRRRSADRGDRPSARALRRVLARFGQAPRARRGACVRDQTTRCSSRTPRSSSFARASRDATVPIGRPSTPAISSSGKSSQ